VGFFFILRYSDPPSISEIEVIMQIQFEALVPLIQSHPFEFATGMLASAAVTAAVQRSSVFESSPTGRSLFAAMNGVFAGVVISACSMQPKIELKVISAVATVAFVALAVRPRKNQPVATAPAPAAAAKPPAPAATASASAAEAATAAAISDEPASFQELVFYELIAAISKCADADGLFRVPGSAVTINRLFEQLFPEQAVETLGKPKPSTVKKARRAFSSLRGKSEKASAPVQLSEADMKGLIKALDANDLVGLFKKMLKECADFQHLLSEMQDDLTQVFSGAKQPTSDEIRALVRGEKFPAPKRGLLKDIIQMLANVARENDQMGSDNLSTCMAPNFFMPGDDPMADITLVPTQNAAVAFMIEHCEEIFGSDQNVKAARS